MVGKKCQEKWDGPIKSMEMFRDSRESIDTKFGGHMIVIDKLEVEDERRLTVDVLTPR